MRAHPFIYIGAAAIGGVGLGISGTLLAVDTDPKTLVKEVETVVTETEFLMVTPESCLATIEHADRYMELAEQRLTLAVAEIAALAGGGPLPDSAMMEHYNNEMTDVEIMYGFDSYDCWESQ